LVRKVVVPVDERHFAKDAIDAGGDRVGLGLRGDGKKKKGESDSVQTIHGAHTIVHQLPGR